MPYTLSLFAGAGVGVLYAVVGVRSPAPPLIALVGLLGIVLGEQSALLAKQHLVFGPNQDRPTAEPMAGCRQTQHHVGSCSNEL